MAEGMRRSHAALPCADPAQPTCRETGPFIVRRFRAAAAATALGQCTDKILLGPRGLSSAQVGAPQDPAVSDAAVVRDLDHSLLMPRRRCHLPALPQPNPRP
jgi:hypothetical protein